MTTTVVKTLGSAGGRDYSSVAAWVAAAPANLVTADQVWKGEMYNDSNSFVVAGAFDISGLTTDATRFVWLTAATGQSFQDHANKLTNPVRYDQTKGVGLESTSGFQSDAFTMGCNFTLVERLQFKFNYSSHAAGVNMTGSNTLLKNCICYRTVAYAGTSGNVHLYHASSVAVNVVSIDDAATASGFSFPNGDATTINCTAIGTAAPPGRGFSNQYSHPLVRNCVSFGYPTFGRGGGVMDYAAGSDYNATDIAAGTSPNMGPGTHQLTDLVAATEWRDAGASTYDPFPKSGNSLASGTRDQTYTNDLDILGQARSTTTPTRGAVEFVGGGGGGLPAGAESAYFPGGMQPQTSPLTISKW